MLTVNSTWVCVMVSRRPAAMSSLLWAAAHVAAFGPSEIMQPRGQKHAERGLQLLLHVRTASTPGPHRWRRSAVRRWRHGCPTLSAAYPLPPGPGGSRRAAGKCKRYYPCTGHGTSVDRRDCVISGDQEEGLHLPSLCCTYEAAASREMDVDGLNRTATTAPGSVHVRTQRAVATSHSRSVRSSEPKTRCTRGDVA